MDDNGRKRLSVQLSNDLYAAVMQEANDKAISASAVIRWALMDRYERQRQEWEARQPSGIPATP